MSPAARLAAFALLLAVMVGLGAAVGSAVGPIGVGGADGHETTVVDTTLVEGHGLHGSDPSGH